MSMNSVPSPMMDVKMDLSDSPNSSATSSTSIKRARSPDPTTASSTSSIPQQRFPVNSTPPSATNPTRSTPSASSFRNVSACNRCRLRKNRCDQNLPACLSCEKAGARCVGYDPITKREIPRSYVNYLETRLSYLEDLLVRNQIPFESATTFDLPPPTANTAVQSPVSKSPAPDSHSEPPLTPGVKIKSEEDQLVSDIATVSVQGTSDPRYLGSVSGISFARVVVAAVKSTNANGSQRGRLSSIGSADDVNGAGGMRDSFFGLASNRCKYNPAKFPSRKLGMRLIRLYFEHANPQLPTLHRGEFEKLAERVYNSEGPFDGSSYAPGRGAKEMYMMNIVFAIGAGIFLTKDVSSAESGLDVQMADGTGGYERNKSPNRKRRRLSQDRGDDPADRQHQPEEYHAAAISHLEAFLSSDSKGGVEELQAILLLAGYALLRPVAPGLWYIAGVAMRLAVDLGLHYEDGTSDLGEPQYAGRRAWQRDMKRRLWWCTYSIDRLVSTCVGRPFGIPDECVSTKFPSLLDDRYITPEGFLEAPPGAPSYKHIAYYYFKMRLLQSEILQVLLHQTHNLSAHPPSSPYPNEHPNRLQPPFLAGHTIDSWHKDITRRVKAWHDQAPRSKSMTGVDFCFEFLDVNYWQTLIMLYRPSLKVPSLLATTIPQSSQQATVDKIARGVGIGSLHAQPFSRAELEAEETTCIIVAEAGSKILRLYRQLHRVDMVNYTYLATHHIFMAGVSYLYAIWHSAAVRQRYSMDEIEFTTWAGTSVLEGLTPKCPPAETCKRVFERMAQLTLKTYMQANEAARPQQFNNTVGVPQTPQQPVVQPQGYSQAPPAGSMPPPPLFDRSLHSMLFAPAPSMPQQNLPSPPNTTPPPRNDLNSISFPWNDGEGENGFMPLLEGEDNNEAAWDDFVMMSNPASGVGIGSEVMGGFGESGDTFGGFFFGN